MTLDDWKVMRLLKTFLEPFLNITKVIEGNSEPTISIIYPMIAKLTRKVASFDTEGNSPNFNLTDSLTGHPDVAKFRDLVLADLKKRFLEISHVAEIAVVLDPRTRHGSGPDPGNPYLSHDQLQKCWMRLSQRLTTVLAQQLPTLAVETTSIWSATESPTKRQRVVEPVPVNSASNALLGMELQRYMYYAPPLNPDQTPGDWWKANKTTFPHIYIIAMEYLAIPATSAESERLFSLAKLFMSIHQTEKSPQYLCDQVFVNRNWDLVKSTIKVSS